MIAKLHNHIIYYLAKFLHAICYNAKAIMLNAKSLMLNAKSLML